MAKNLGGTPRADLDGRSGVAFSDAVTIADVHRLLPTMMQSV
jgi:hypothetical protein